MTGIAGTPRGRLELTWANKGQSLLAPDDGSYSWVSPTDHRIAEVRLIHDADTVGSTHPAARRAADNLLIRGDALNAMGSLIKLPEVRSDYVGKVKLCYIDPPFNTGEVFDDYADGLEHSVWLTMMRDRLAQIKELLAEDGSVWVHLDDIEAHRARCVLDEMFGPDNFVATIVWQKRTSRDNRAAFSSAHDYIHVYSPAGTAWKNSRNRLDDSGDYSNPDNDPRGPWRSVPMSAQAGHATAAQFYTVVTPTGVEHPPPDGRAWTYTRERFDELVAEDRVYWPRQGDGKPRLKMFPWESEGLVPFTLWMASEVGENSDANAEIRALFPDAAPFATPKPERLLERIIGIATNPGDLVLDCFVGSGTTAAVAHKMDRRWIAIEREGATVETYSLPRLTKVVEGTDPGGITEMVGWQGGGGFRVLDVAPSMFAEHAGALLIADWAANGALAEATAAQFGYEYIPESPFAGRRGRMRLAVIDGLVTESVVEMLVAALTSDERVAVYGTSIDVEARDLLRAKRPGSTLAKIPPAILAAYQAARPTFLRRHLQPAQAPPTVDVAEAVEA